MQEFLNVNDVLFLLATSPEAKTYYISLSVVNKSPYNTTLSYLENGQLKEQDLLSGGSVGITSTMTASQQPGEIAFKAFQKGSNAAMTLNGNETLMVRPTETLVTIGVTLDGGTF